MAQRPTLDKEAMWRKEREKRMARVLGYFKVLEANSPFYDAVVRECRDTGYGYLLARLGIMLSTEKKTQSLLNNLLLIVSNQSK